MRKSFPWTVDQPLPVGRTARHLAVAGGRRLRVQEGLQVERVGRSARGR